MKSRRRLLVNWKRVESLQQRPSGPAAQRLKHPHSSQMIECTPTVAQGWQVCRYADFFNKPFSAPLTPALCESQGFQYSDES